MLSTILFTSSCIDQNTKLAGDFALSGFDFDIEAPIAALSSSTSRSRYVKSNTFNIDIDTGSDLINCASFDRIAITETDEKPSSSDFRYSCNNNGTQTISYTFQDTTEGERTIYLWSYEESANKLSAPAELDLILDTTPPTGSLSVVDNFVQGGTTHSVTLISSDNLQLASDTLTISHNSSGNWEDIDYESSFFTTNHDVTFPIMDSSNSHLRYLLTDAAGNETEIISNTFIIDSTAPTLSITTPPAFLTGGSTYDIDYNIFDLNGIDTWSLSYSQDDGISYTTIQNNPSKPFTWSVPLSDTNTAKIRLNAADVAGNSTYVASSAFTIDSTAPSVSLTNPPTWLQGGSIYNISFSASDANGLSSFILEYAQDGTNFTTLATTNTSPYAWSVPSVDISANAALRLTAIDNAGNSSSTTSTNFGIDSTDPVASLSNMAAVIRGAVNNNVTLNSSDAASGVSTANLYFSNDSGSTYSLITALPATPTYSWNTPALDNETARLRYVVTDGVGNVTTVENTVFEIDSTAPASTLDSPAARVRGNDTLSLNFTATDKNSVNTLSFEYAADGTNFSVLSSSPTSPYSWNIPTTNTTNSKIRLVSTDSVGNQTIIESTSFDIDSTPSPAPSISLNSDLYTNQTATTLTMGNCTDIDSVFINESTAPSRDDAGWQSCSTNAGAITYTLPSVEGEHTLKAWTKDDVGNVSLTATDVTVYYDITNPALTISTPPLLAGNSVHTINWTLTEQYIDTTLSFNIDYWNGSSWFDITDQTLTNGPHSSQAFSHNWTTPSLDRDDILIRIQVSDLAGNSATIQTSAFEIDSTAPASTLTDLPSLLQGGNSHNIVFTSTDANGIDSLVLQYAANGSTFSNIVSTPTSPYSWTIPTDDTSNARVRLISTDPVGNQTVLTTSAFEVDSTPPSAPTISLQTPQYTTSTAISFTMSACNQNFDEVLINTGSAPSQGDAAWQSCNTTSGGITHTIAASEGPHSLSAWAKDDAGNVSLTSTDFTIYYDVTDPVISITNPGLLAGNNTYTINWSLTEAYINSTRSFNVDYWNGSSWQDIATIAATTGPHSTQGFSSSWTTPGLNRTDIRLRVQVTDLAGNSTTSQSTNFEIDSIPPGLTISSPANNSYAKNSVVLSGNCESSINITFSGDITEAFDINCTTGTYSQTVNFLNPGIDESKTINVSQTDNAGNTTNQSIIVINDNIAPSITRTTPTSPILTNTNSISWQGNCEGNYPINVSGDHSQTFNCSSGTWNWSTPTITSDGTYNFLLSQTDGAGNTSTSLPLQWTRDQTPPVFNHQRSSPESNNKSSLVFSGQCEGINAIAITGSFTQTIGCSSGSWNWTTPTVSSDGTFNFTFTHTDESGNQSILSHSWTRDTTGPDILIDLAKEVIKSNTDSVTITGSCDTSLVDTTISVSGVDTATTTCDSGIFSYDVTTQSVDQNRIYNFSQTNNLGTTTTVSSSWIRETDLPTISSVDKDASVTNPTTTNFVLTDLLASSSNPDVGISEFCFKSQDSSQPNPSDECWVRVNAPHVGLTIGQNLNLNDFSNLIGWQPTTYTIYSFVKDEAGNISTLTNSGAGTLSTDSYQITYDPGIPPVPSNIIAANVDNTSNPPTLAENNVSAGSDVYIRWKATDNSPLPSGAITLNYTENEIDFIPITLTDPSDPYNSAANLTGLNNSNYGCPNITLASDEGCYKWTGGSPLSSSYKIQVNVTDATDLTVKAISNPLNTGRIKLLAGNTESGLGGSAQAAMFYTHDSTSEIDPKSLVITETGDLYFADEKRGLLTIDRSDGKQKILIPTTGFSSGDGGVATAATLTFPTRITLDYQNRLLVLDRNKIRRIDLNQSPPTIDTIIGGGSDTSDTVSDPLQLEIYNHGNSSWTHAKIPFSALPNGDIIFMSEYGRKSETNPNHRFRIYKAATKSVESFYIVKDGVSWDTGTYYHKAIDTANPDYDLSNCRVSAPSIAFDPLTSEITGIRAVVEAHYSWVDCPRNDGNTTSIYYTMSYFDPITGHVVPDLENYDQFAAYAYHHMVTGMDGNLYQVVYDYYVNKINFDGTSTRVLGTGIRGRCEDGTQATSCNISIDDFFVSQSGKFYFSDSGVIRTVENDGTITTLAGQSKTYGDGINALNARLASPLWISQKNDGKITYGDGYYLKEFTIEGNVNILAGNGNYDNYNDENVDARTVGLYSHDWWEQDPVSGDIYSRSDYRRLVKLNYATGEWEVVVGGGSNEYWLNDNNPGLSQRTSRHLLPLGMDENGKILTSHMNYNSTDKHYEDFMWKLYDPLNSFMQTHVAGTNDPLKTYVGGNYGMIDGAPTSSSKIPYYSYTGPISWDPIEDRWIVIQYNGGSNNTNSRNVWSVDPDGVMSVISYLARPVQHAYTHARHSGKEWLYYKYGNRLYSHNLTDDVDGGALEWSMSNLNVQGYKLIYNSSSHSLIFPCKQNGLGCVAQYFLP